MAPTDKGHSIEDRLKADPRFQTIGGSMLSHGSGAGRLELGNVVGWYQNRVRDVGPDSADAELEKFLESDKISIVQALWVYGEITESILTITRDTQLVPLQQMPASDEKR